jgi:hypothetical protein
VTAPVAMAGDAFPLMKAGSSTIGQNNEADWSKLFYQGLMFNPGSDGFVRRGVLHRGWKIGTEPQELKVLELGNGPNLQVNPGLFVVQKGNVTAPDRGAFWGGALGTTPQTINMPAAPGANLRYDAVYACVKNKNLSQDSADPVVNNGPYLDVRSGATGGSLNLNGTPGTAGAPPVTPDGYLPLAFVARATSDNNISQAEIIDCRRGTAITGTPRTMFPWDITNIVADTGVYLSEERYRPAAGVYPAFLDRWDGTTWRGTCGPISFAQPAQTLATTLAPGASASVASGKITIPWPGFPYKIRANGDILWTIGTGAAREINGEINLDSDLYTGPGAGPAFIPPTTALGWNNSYLVLGGQTELRVAALPGPVISDGNPHVLSFWVLASGANAVNASFFGGLSYRFVAEIIPA